MPDIFEVELPNGQIVEIESDSPPTDNQLNSLLTEVLPKYRVERPRVEGTVTLDDAFQTFPFNTRESRVARGATPTAIKNTKFYEAFKAAKIGESVVDDETKNTVIKTSDDEFVSPTVESSKYKEQTATESALRAGTAALGPTAAALAAGSRAAAAVPGPPIARLGALGAALLAGGATAIGTRLAQDKLIDAIDPEQNQLLQAGYETNPTASFVGELAANAPFMRPGLSPESVRSTVRNVVGGGVLGGAVQAGTEIATAPGDELMREGAAKRIALAAAAEGVFNRPTKLGEGIGIGRVGESLKKPVPEAPATPKTPAKPTLVTQIDSGVAPITIAEGESVTTEPVNQSVLSRIESMMAPTGAPSGEESAKAFDFLPRRAAESALELEKLPPSDKAPDPSRSTEVPESLVMPREVLAKFLEDELGPNWQNEPARTATKDSGKIIDSAISSGEQAAIRNAEEARIEAIQDSYNKVIGVDPNVKLSATETEIVQAFNRGSEPISSLVGKEVVYDGQSGKLSQEADGAYYFVPDKKVRGKARIAVPAPKGAGTPASVSGVFEKNVALLANIRSKKVAAPEAAIASEPTQPVQVRATEAPQSTLSKIEATAEAGPTRVAVDDDDAIEAAAAAQAKRKFKGVSQAGSKGSVLIPGEASPRFKTPEFKKWFGKGIFKDKDGNPVALFHGTKSKEKFSSFDTERRGYHFGKGSYFTPSPGRADDYAGFRDYYEEGSDAPEGSRVLKVFTSIENPYYVSSDQSVSDLGRNLERTDNAKFKKLEVPGGTYADVGNALVREMGYDSIIKQWKDGDPLEVVVFDNKKIKSATGNSGQFNSGMSDISAGINPTLLVDAGSTFIGATLGYQVGDTQEERLRNAAIGAAIGAGGRVGAKALTKAIKSSPKLVSAIKAKSPETINNLKKEFKEDTYNYLFDDTPAATSTDAVSQVPDQYDNTRILGDGVVANALREAILGIDAAIRSVSPRIYGALMRYETDKNFITKTYQEISGRFHTAARKLITNPEDQTAYFRAVRAGDMEAINSIAQKYPQYSDDIVAAYNDSRQMLDGIYGLLGEAGRKLNYVTNYFPRSVGDYKGLKKALGQEMAGVFDNAISAYKKERGLDRELTGEEIAKVINQTLGGTFAAGKKPSFMKARSIDEITEKIEKFYDPEDVALEKYVIKAAQDINNRHWFGSAEIPSNVEGLQLEGSFGKFLAEEIQSKKLTPADQKIISDNLQARRSMDRISSDAWVPITGAMRNLTSLTMLGDATSGVAQLGDVIITVQNSGLRSGVKGTKQRLSRFLKENFGGSKGITQESDGVTLADLMLDMNTDEINQFAINNRGRIAKSTESVLKNTVGRFDRFGKEALVNSAFDQFKRAARNMDSREGRRLRSKYEEVFPEDFDAMVDDLKAGKLTDRTRLLLVTELSQMQPVLPSSMPALYAKNPNARLVYTLKSFWVRQLNRIRSESVEKIVKGYRTDNVGVMAEGLAWLGQYTALMGATGAAIDMTRDLWLGRENDPEEIAVANMMKVIGFSKYNSLEASRSGYDVAAFKWLFPLGEVVDDVFRKDLQAVVKYAKERNPTSAKTYEDLFKELESVQYIPYVGRTLYNRFGAGKVKEEKRQYDKYLGKSQPTVGSSIINLIDPKYKPEREK